MVRKLGNYDNMLTPFEKIPERDKQTDRRTHGRAELLYHSAAAFGMESNKVSEMMLVILRHCIEF